MSFPQQETASITLHVAQDNKTHSKRKQHSRQEAVAFAQNQNIICDSVLCQACVVWIVIAGNIVIGKGLRSVKPETCMLKSLTLFLPQTQVLLITVSFGRVYGIYCFLPVCAGTRVTALVFCYILRVPTKPHVW